MNDFIIPAYKDHHQFETVLASIFSRIRDITIRAFFFFFAHIPAYCLKCICCVTRPCLPSAWLSVPICTNLWLPCLSPPAWLWVYNTLSFPC